MAKKLRFIAVMPTFNQDRYLMEAIDSVVDQLDLLCIVDDCSTDSTAEKILALEKSRGAFYHMRHATNEGSAAAINSGIKMVEDYYPEEGGCEDWVTWVSSDNVHTSDWVEIFSSFLVENPGHGVVYTGLDWGGRRKLFVPYAPDRQIRTENCFLGPSFFVRRDVWKRCGGHRGKISHDLDHFLRLEETCWEMGLELRGIKKFPCFYRVHRERVTVTRKHQYDAPHWIEEAKKRRGQAAVD